MSKAWFPFYMNDYSADTPLLKLADHGAYLLLMIFYWNSDASVPASAEDLHALCRCRNDAERDAVDSVVQKHFTEVDGMLVNKRLDIELAKAHDISVKRSKAAFKMHSNKVANADASAVQKHTQSQSQSHTNKQNKSEKVIDPDDLKTSEWIWNMILALDSNRKKPNLIKWADVIRLMRERDGLTHKEICTVFKWANADSFWQSNILSPTKLREKFSDLKIKMKAGGGRTMDAGGGEINDIDD